MYNKNGNIGASVPDNKQLSRLLRIKVLFLLAAIGLSGSVAAQTSSPNARISLDLQNVPLKEVFARIEDQSNYIFVYYDSILDASRRVSISVSDQPVGNVLEVLFAGTENTWKLSGRQIVIGKAAAAGKAEKQTPLRVMGSVKDTNGEPLIGVTVFVKERPSVGTATDINGNYLIDVQTDDVLEFSYVGYKTQDVAVAGRGLLDIVLEQNDAILDAVEVVGYGVQKKISVIGSQQSIQVKELKVPVANLTQGLAGRVAGLVSVQRTSEPGFDDADIYIRGISTLTASMSAPLTLVDGVPRSFANVDPEDIESFSILKDASATAVYGVRGANGVIIINTKSGSKGRPKFTVRYTEGITTPTKITDFVDGATYMEMSNEASMTRGGGALYSREVIEKTRTHADPYLYPNVDWMDEILRDYSHNRSANVNVSGGSDKAVYYIGLAYYDEDGMYKDTKLSDYNSNTYYRRYNVTTNLTLNPFRTTEIKLGIQGYLANANYPASAQSTIFESAYFTQPTYIAPLYPDGKLGAFSGGELNPVAELGATGYANQWRSQVYSNLRITQQLYKGLSITGMFSFDTYNYTSNRFTKSPNTYHATGRDANGNLIYEQTRQGTENLAYSLSAKGDRTIYLEAALNYKNTFGRHDVSGMLLFNQSDEINTKATNVEEALPYRFRGLAGRFTYGFDNRYFIEGNFGYNGSENFSPGKRFGFFPSVAAGYVISNEKFFEPVRGVIDLLKIKASYGIVGNDKIGTGDNVRRFIYNETVVPGNSYNFGTSTQSYAGTRLGDWANPNVGWEEAHKLNVGVDLSLFSKLKISADYFKERREGIFLERASIPVYVGLSTKPWVNIGKMRNSGVDASLEYHQTIGQDLHLTVRGNFTYARNMIVDQDQPDYKYLYMNRTGQARYQTFGLVAAGLFRDQADIDAWPKQSFGDVEPGDIKYLDLNGDGVVDSYDVKPIGYTAIPEIVYGFGFSLQWKAFDFSAFFQGVGHVNFSTRTDQTQGFIARNSREANLFSDVYDNYWTPERLDAKYPRLFIGTNNNNNQNSSFWMANGRYMRLKNLEIGYTLPKHISQKMAMQNMRVYLSGVNLFTFSPFKLWDPDLQTGATNYPNNRIINIGLTIGF